MQEVARQRLSNEEVVALCRAAAQACAREPSVVVAYLHGSVARDEPARDIDLALYFADVPSSAAMFASCARVAAAIEAKTHPVLPLDVRPLNGASPPFRFAVLSEGRRLHVRSEDERVVLEARWASEWHDFAPFWHRQVDRVLGVSR
ncbi:MAG: nucleotidyltransferase domain-containing protein [Myxococcota bacterium]